MAATILRNARLHVTSEEFEGKDALAVLNHRIVPLDPTILEDVDSEEIELNGMHVAPGLIDLLVNGCAGVSFSNDITPETLDRMRRWQSQHGTLSFVPTLISGPRENMSRALGIMKVFMQNHPGVCPGIHLEGPFINSDRKGFHPAAYIRGITDTDISQILEFRQNIAYMTVAPESIKSKQLNYLVQNHINVSLGHTNCSYNDAMRAFRIGVRNVTHLYNGMRSVTGRDPGLIGAVLNTDGVYAGIIADGRHVHPAVINILRKLMLERLYIVSDAQSVAGSPELVSTFTIAGTEVFVDANRGLIDSKGSLAGTNVCLMDCVKFLVKVCGFTLDQALRCATETPAKILGIDHEYGRIEGGFMADLIIFDDDYTIRYVIKNGFLKNIAEIF